MDIQRNPPIQAKNKPRSTRIVIRDKRLKDFIVSVSTKDLIVFFSFKFSIFLVNINRVRILSYGKNMSAGWFKADERIL